MKKILLILFFFLLLNSCKQEKKIQKENIPKEMNLLEIDGKRMAKLTCKIGELSFKLSLDGANKNELKNEYVLLVEKLDSLKETITKKHKDDKDALKEIGEYWQKAVEDCESQLNEKYKDLYTKGQLKNE